MVFLKRYFCLAFVLELLILQFGCTQGLVGTENSGTGTQVTEEAEHEDTANRSSTNSDISTIPTNQASATNPAEQNRGGTTATSEAYISTSGIVAIKCIGENDEIKIAHFLEADPPKKVLYYGIDKVEIITGSGTQDLVDAFKNGSVTEEKIFSFLDEQVKSGRGKTAMYKDGGSIQYDFEGFTVLRMKSYISGSRDIAFIRAGKDINNLFDFCVKPTNTTVANG